MWVQRIATEYFYGKCRRNDIFSELYDIEKLKCQKESIDFLLTMENVTDSISEKIIYKITNILSR